ncbi:hypothetical protein EPUS_04516 [Endocarpon pusillum Z07020]|uniref:Uncharacterized protein n=1 Tax=Endocarpon pusillum (strain Z07020 / HMAS-L-300199) TaxID=1263415 RepID=U1HIX6_ENDPU|nr:uncharacterized protein EPUS_04516 [Endocarpon pusillum Z07020]ERF68864.1 hypothetical protein EPUS_04516 [Endocarpon pusillum Z07020]
MDTTTTSSLVSRREGRTTRRSSQRVEDVERVYVGRNNQASAKTSNLRKIVCSLIRFDLWTLDTLRSAFFKTHPQIINRGVYERFEELLDAELVALHEWEDLYEFGFEVQLQGYLGRLSVQQLLEYVRDLRTSTYYAQLMHLRLVMADMVRTEFQYAEKTSDRTILQHMDWCKTHQEYLAQLVAGICVNSQNLRAIEREASFLRDHVKHAVESGDLDDTTLMQLRRKFEALQELYPDVCVSISGDRRDILTYKHVLWWDPDAEERRLSERDQPPRTLSKHTLAQETSARHYPSLFPQSPSSPASQQHWLGLMLHVRPELRKMPSSTSWSPAPLCNCLEW